MEIIMKKHLGLMMLLALSLNVWACTKPNTPQQGLNINRANVATETAIVEKIDMKKRMVTIRGPEGHVMTIHAGKEVVNLPQVRVGDKVVLEYVESVAVRMAKPGEVKDEVRELAGRAKPGDKPGYAEASETTVTATILDLDKVRMTATLKMPDGEVEVVRVQDPANLEKVKVGETIVITYTEAVALSIQEKAK